MKDQKEIFNQIEASLSYGLIKLPKLAAILLWVLLALCGIGFIVILLCAIFYSMNEVMIGAVFFIVIGFAISMLFLYFYRRQAKVKCWLKDAVPLKAKCALLGKMPEGKEIDGNDEGSKILLLINSPTNRFDGDYSSPRILVTFRYNGKIIRRMSGKQGYSEYEMDTGRHPIFRRFIGKEVDILYSPKYDEVLLLKLKD